MKIKIEKGVVIPKKTRNEGNNRFSIYPLDDMEINDSFLAPCTKDKRKVSMLLGTVLSRHTNKFTQRRVKGGIRVWRIA